MARLEKATPTDVHKRSRNIRLWAAPRAGLVLALLLPAAWIRPASGQAVEVELDHAAFYDAEAGPYLELYLSFEARSIPFRPDSTGYVAEVSVAVSLTPEGSDAPAHGTSTTLAFSVPDPAALRPGQQFLHVLRLPAPPGAYTMHAAFAGPDGEAARVSRSVDVPVFEGRVRLSDAVLASDARPDDGSTSVLSKSGVSLLPNPGLLFGSGLSRLHYYVEAYGLTQTEGEGGSYRTRAFVTRSGVSSPVPGYEEEKDLEAGGAQALLGSFDLSLLSNGSYAWNIELTDRSGAVLSSLEKKFFVYNPGVERGEAAAAAATGAEVSPFEIIPEEELDRLWEQMEVIASRDERRQLRRLDDLEARRAFAARFWTRRDPDPRTPVNEFREEFDMRVRYARERFEESKREGWDTVRGRVVVKYGIPDDIQDRLNENDTVPHSIWSYTNIPGVGRALFVFADRQGFGSFELIHSDAPGETRSPNWQAEIVRR